MAGSNISLTYNGVTIGGDQFALQLHDYQIEFAYDTFRVEALVSLHSDTASNLKTLRDSTIAALTAFSKDFSIQRGATVIWSVDESEKTQGYLARPNFDLLNTPEDHELRQTFKWSCTFMRGATSTEDEGGRLAAQISVTTDAANYNTITISGTYTAVPAQGLIGKRDAREAYVNNVGAFVTGILTLIGGAQYKVVADNYQFDDESARLLFTATRRQVKVPENASGTFEAGIREQSISFTAIETSSLGIPRSRVSMFQAAYTAQLDTAVVAHTGQEAFYENTILPHVTLLLRSLLGGTVAVDNHQKTFRYDASSISVAIQGSVVFGDGDLYRHERTVSYRVSTQKEFRERWDGRQHSRITATPGPVIEAEVVVEEVVVGDPRILGIANVSSGPASSPGPFDLEREANYMRPGVPPFPAALTLANQRAPGPRISVGGSGGANSQGAGANAAGGAPPKPQPARPLDDPSFDDDPFTPGFQRPFNSTSYDDDPFTDGIQPPIGGITTVAREAGGKPPVPGGAADGGGSPAELIWVLMEATCEAGGKFIGYNNETNQENFSKIKVSSSRYITRWVWAIEEAAPVATILVQPGTPTIAPDSPAERGIPG